MAEVRMPIYGVFDQDTGRLVGFAPSGSSSAPLAGAATGQTVTLTADYTLTPADADCIFIAAANVVVTIPPMARNISCIFVPKTSASITLRPTGGVVLDGGTTDVLRSVVTDPVGFALVPSFGSANVYGTTYGSPSFSKLAGSWQDNTDLAAAINGKINTTERDAIANMNGTQKMTGPFTCNNAQKGILYWTNATVDRTLTIPQGLDLNYTCRIAKFGSAAGAFIVSPAAGVTLYVKGDGRRLTGTNVSATIRCVELNTFYIDGAELVV